MTTAQIDAFLAEIGYTPFQPFEDLPRQVCSQCDKPKLRGLFTPLELKSTGPRCMRCVGLLSQKSRERKWNAGREPGWNNRRDT